MAQWRRATAWRNATGVVSRSGKQGGKQGGGGAKRHACLLQSLGSAQRRTLSNDSTAVCMTGQLRGLQIAVVNLWQHLLAPLHGPDLFHVGPADGWYGANAALLHQLPGFVAEKVYESQLRFGRWPERSELLFLGVRLTTPQPDEVDIRVDEGAASSQQRPILHVNLATLPHRYEGDARALRVLIQLLQQQECLGLVEAAERRAGAQYARLVRLRPDGFLGSPLAPAAMHGGRAAALRSGTAALRPVGRPVSRLAVAFWLLLRPTW